MPEKRKGLSIVRLQCYKGKTKETSMDKPATRIPLALPREMDRELTQYPGSSVARTGLRKNHQSAFLDCGVAPMETVFNYYAARLSAGGFKTLHTTEEPDHRTLVFAKGERRGLVDITTRSGYTITCMALSMA